MNRIVLLLCLAGGVCGTAGAATLSFNDEFNSPVLDAAWTVVPGQGVASLTARPGYLRYQLTGSTHPSGDAVALRLSRPFEGSDWLLEFGVDYTMGDGNGRQEAVQVFFGDSTASATSRVGWFRTKDNFGGGPASGEDVAFTVDGGAGGPNNRELPLSGDTHFVRVARTGQDVSVSRSSDGLLWDLFLTHTFAADLGEDQVVQISGWQFRSGQLGIADYDYMRVTSAVPEPGTFGLVLAGAGLVVAGVRRSRNPGGESPRGR